MPRKPKQAEITVETHRVNVGLPTPIFDALKEWAEAEKRSPGNLASLLLEEKIREEIQNGSYPVQRLIEKRTGMAKEKEGKSQNHSQINVLDLQRLANQLGIPSDRLLQAINEIKLEVVNGA